ncbi:CheY-like superfamily [Aspergillus oleicola]
MHILLAEDKYLFYRIPFPQKYPLTTSTSNVHQKLITRTLDQLNCTYVVVPDGQKALDYLSAPPSTHPRPDVILMDLAMPILSGFSATEIIRTLPPYTTDPLIPNTPIIALTAGFLLRGEYERLRSKGFDDVLVKPIRRAHLPRILEYWVRRRVVPGPRPGPIPRVDGALPLLGGSGVVPIRPEVWGKSLRGVRGPRSLL